MRGLLFPASFLVLAGVAGVWLLTQFLFADRPSEWQTAGIRPAGSSSVSWVPMSAYWAQWTKGVVGTSQAVAQDLTGRDDESQGQAAIDAGEAIVPKFSRIAIKPGRSASFEGFGEPGGRVALKLDGRNIGGASIGRNGRWNLSTLPLGPGDHSIVLETLDAGRDKTIVGQVVRVAIPKNVSASEIVAYEEPDAEAEARVRARAERLAEAASREFDSYSERETRKQNEVRRQREERSTAQREQEQRRQEERLAQARREAEKDELPEYGPVGRWYSRSSRDYHDYVVPELARKGGGGSGAPISGAPIVNVPPPGRPGDPSGEGGGFSFDSVFQRTGEWLRNANRTYQDEIVRDLSTGPSGESQKAQSEADRRAREKRAVEAAELERLEAERQRRRERLARLQEEEKDRVRRAAEDRAEAERQAALRRAKQREAEAGAKDEERRRPDAILSDRQRQQELAERNRKEQAEADERARLDAAERERLALQRRQGEIEENRLQELLAQREAERLRALEEARLEREQAAADESGRLEAERAQKEAFRQQLAEREKEQRLSAKVRRAQRVALLADEAGFGRREIISEDTTETAVREPLLPERRRDFDVAAWTSSRSGRRLSPSEPADWNVVEEKSRRADLVARLFDQAYRDHLQAVRSDRYELVAEEPRVRYNVPFRSERLRRPSTKRYKKRRKASTRSAGWRARSRRGRGPEVTYGTGCKDRRAGQTIRVPGTYVVARGDTLWHISRRHYRKGYRYGKIYRSNRNKIRNPHWIYPCQKFWLPRQ